MSAQPKAPSEYITAGATIELERAGYGARIFDVYALAQAQCGLDADIGFVAVANAPKEYAARVWELMQARVDPPVPRDTASGVDFGAYHLRQPTGLDLVFSERGEFIQSMANCFARCADMPLADVLAMPYTQYIAGFAWLGEELGVSAWRPAPN